MATVVFELHTDYTYGTISKETSVDIPLGVRGHRWDGHEWKLRESFLRACLLEYFSSNPTRRQRKLYAWLHHDQNIKKRWENMKTINLTYFRWSEALKVTMIHQSLDPCVAPAQGYEHDSKPKILACFRQIFRDFRISTRPPVIQVRVRSWADSKQSDAQKTIELYFSR